METLLVAEHGNEYYSRSKTHGPIRFGSFGSHTSRDFREINCRTFQSGAGILPTPFKSCSTPVTKRALSSSFSPKTPSPSVGSYSESNYKHSKRPAKSSAISIPVNIKADFDKKGFFNAHFSYSELWAGPAYSNSPPPSSLPMPHFSLKPKRTVSLDLPASPFGIELDHPISKSAPPSPTREHNTLARDFFHGADSATKTLRRILNLDIADD